MARFTKRRRSRPSSTSLPTRRTPAAPSFAASASKSAEVSPFGHAEELVDVRELHPALGERGDHVEDALRVAQRALRVPSDRLERGRLACQALLLADLRELSDDALVRDPPKVEALRAGHDGRWDLSRFGRRQHEDDVRRRLLERLEQRVEGLARELVRLVDDVDLVLTLRRREAHLVAQIAHLIDTAIGCGVDLDEIEEGAVADRDAVL